MCLIDPKDMERFEKGEIELARDFKCRDCKAEWIVNVQKNRAAKCPECGSKNLELGTWHYADKKD